MRPLDLKVPFAKLEPLSTLCLNWTTKYSLLTLYLYVPFAIIGLVLQVVGTFWISWYLVDSLDLVIPFGYLEPPIIKALGRRAKTHWSKSSPGIDYK